MSPHPRAGQTTGKEEDVFMDEEEEKTEVASSADADAEQRRVADVAELAGIYVVDPQDSISIAPKPTPPEKEMSVMSTVTKNYDLDRKGYLDDTEKMMRSYDRNNDGKLDLSEVYKIVEDVRRQQSEIQSERKKVLGMKKIIITLVLFTLILAVSMLGVSFAAARLARDTSVDPNTYSLSDRYTGVSLSTVPASRVSAVEAADTEFDDGDDNGGEEEDESGEGQRRRSRFLFSSASSRAARELRRMFVPRRHAPERRGTRRRRLLPCFGWQHPCAAGIGDEGEIDEVLDAPTTRISPSSSPGPAAESAVDALRADWKRCGQLQGKVRKYQMRQIRNSFEDGDDSVNLIFKNGGTKYRERIHIQRGVSDRDTEFLVIESGLDIDCASGRSGSGCSLYKPVFIFDNCGRTKCDLFTCYLGVDNVLVQNV